MHPTGRDLTIGPLRRELIEQRCRLVADVDGEPVWFESSTPLTPAPEALAGLFWIPVLHARRRLVSATPLDPQWIANVQCTLPILHQWWDYPEESPLVGRESAKEARLSDVDAGDETGESLGQMSEVPAMPIPGTRPERDPLHQAEEAEKPRAVGLCFSCGMDSFYSLLRSSHPIDTLVYAHGFDIPHDDWRRMRHREQSLQEVATATSKQLIIVRTNLRSHHFFRLVNWERTHGAALAALGHVLSGTLNHLVIAASYRYRNEHPWGSNWRLDPLWSSSRMTVIHDDATHGRQGKTGRIAGNQLVQRHLLVCWSGRTPVGNCGNCEKCVRMMVTLESLGRLHEFTVFPGSTPLSQRIDSLDPLPPHLHPIWSRLGRKPLPGEVVAAVDRLLARSDPSVSPWTRWWRTLRHRKTRVRGRGR